ncbi:antibiotic biosynthesis monooxygenase family protein [Donghicola mangrovi]|uniref:Antibiotic biosynthesis monooxygenase n=1 Tax=Donghicola mangrovi TaxID=2729614 RepID=A0A850Q743_9RHOB|nr:antibiotic biosynthesis monooxygenase [Donghicola mangrovi]NVO25617.1 antibiotic biosynthesis monooxygenase [Donghicola mangrovi]
MIAVIFEASVPGPAQTEYLDLAAELRPLLDDLDGFIAIERFQSLTTPGKVLSLSFWRDEAAVAAWRNLPQHRRVQAAGRHHVFADYRLRIAEVTRDYGMTARDQAPLDSRAAHATGT